MSHRPWSRSAKRSRSKTPGAEPRRLRPGASLRRPLAVLAAAVLGAATLPAVAHAAVSGAAVSPQLLTELKANGATSFMVYLKDRAKLDSAAKLRDSDARATEVHRQLTTTAQRSQSGLRAALDARKATYTSYWIANAVRVKGDKALLDSIAARPEVERIDPVHTYHLIEDKPAAPAKTGPTAGTTGAEWGLTNIEAPRVWSELGVRGEGVVVASIDSGVQYDHPALVGKYRGNLGGGNFDHNYNWYDPAGVCPDAAPCDNNDHGTHTMGTMVGDDGGANQIGVAPGAKWIAAKGCETNDCSDASLLAAGQWVLAPTDLNGENPRPDLHPDIVNNSWGGGQNDLWYQETVAAWLAAGIFPTFSAGNDGPDCDTANSPGDNPEVYAVGSYDVNNQISDFSSRGSSEVDGAVKPNISAPGSSVRSSIPGGGYATISGTSMAAPHVSGTVALVWSASTSLRGDVSATEKLLDDTATDVDALGCGGTVDDNNVFGEGRLNAYQAVNAAPRGPVGRVSGTVTNAAGGAPLAGATVSSEGRSVTTGDDGRYSLTLEAGTHEVTASAYGYASKTVTVEVAEGGAVTGDFALVATPTVTVSGKVTDGSGHGWPLYATIEVAGRPGGPVFTDPFTGKYSFTVPGNTSYKITTTARYPGYRPATTEVAVGATAKTVNIGVPVEPGCTAAGYLAGTSDPLLSQSFDGTEAPAGWSVVNRTDGGGWAFTDAGKRGNLTGGSGGFAIVDSDNLGDGAEQDSDLVTPVLDLSAVTAPYLKFNSDWRAVGLGDTADIDVTSDGGATWTNVWHQTSSRRGPRVEEVPLTPVAGKATAQVRYRFQGSYAWWWEVDNVQLVNRTCTPAPGGLVAGLTTDKNTGAGLTGVKVSSGDRPQETATSAATPDDSNLGDGFYWLFSSLAGDHPFTATKTAYESATKTVTVNANAVRKAAFTLTAGRLTVTPSAVDSHQPYGSTRSTTVTVKNTGSAAATVELLERTGQFQMLSRSGAPLSEPKMKGLSKTRTGTAYGIAGKPAAAPTADDAWSRIADTPAAVYDNAAAAIDGKIYSVGGGGGTGNESKAWVYDPDSDAWTALPNLPHARSKPSAAAVGGKLYVIGGWGDSDDALASVDVFDPTSGTWSTLAGATNPAPAAAAGTAVVNGKVYVIGGCADSECTESSKVVAFDPTTGTFATKADYPHPVSWLGCGGIGDSAYCAGGLGAQEYTDAYSYNPGADSWTALPDLPIDLWGSQAVAAGGLLVLAGGATQASSALTNRALGYDPATRAWRDLPNNQFPRYRGAAACGAYKIGGSPSSFVGSKESERLGGLDLCDETGDVSWLSTSPTTFTLAPGASQKVTVTLTATAEAGVAQPGNYSAELGLTSNTPYPVSSVGVKMAVSPPESWGKVQGTITGQTCAGERVGVKATVQVNLLGAGGQSYTLTSDSTGHYAYWLPKGRYEVIVAKDGWIPKVQRQQIEAGFTSTLDFTLGPVSSCANRVGGI